MTIEIITTPNFEYSGSQIEARYLNRVLYTDSDLGEQAHVLAPKSDTLLFKQVLYRGGFDLAHGLGEAEELPEEVQKAMKLVYADCQRRARRNPHYEPWQSYHGTWHRDGVVIFDTSELKKRHPQIFKKFQPLLEQNYVLARLFQYIQGFEQTEEGWKVKPSIEEEHSRGHLVPLPGANGGFIVPLNGKMFHSVTGTPLKTEEDSETARKLIADGLGISEEQAKYELSRNYRANSGTRAVYSWSSENGGALCVSLGVGPWDSYDAVGSFPAIRVAELSGALEFDFMDIFNEEKDPLLELVEALQR